MCRPSFQSPYSPDLLGFVGVCTGCGLLRRFGQSLQNLAVSKGQVEGIALSVVIAGDALDD